MKIANALTIQSLAVFIFLVVGAPSFSDPKPRLDFDWTLISTMPIQDRGRVKPLDTFARESLEFVSGKKTWKGMSAVEVVFSWLTQFENEWEKEAFVKVGHQGLKRSMELAESVTYFTPNQLRGNANVQRVVREAEQREARRERLTDIDKKALQLRNQLGLIQGIVSGYSWNILPNPQGINQSWFSLASLTESSETPPPYASKLTEKLGAAMRSTLQSYGKGDPIQWVLAVTELRAMLQTELAPGQYPTEFQMERERHFNAFRPFRVSWIFYLVAFLVLLLSNKATGKLWTRLGAVFMAGGFLVHTYGFALRCWISGRPPVTNMYESVIWVTYGCVIFSAIIWMAYKNRVIPMAASVFAVVGLVLADNLPSVLDPGIHPLEPVLRSNFWLTIHVLTITLSYAAFALSLCLGNVVMGGYLFQPKKVNAIQQYTLYMYRAVQIGVVLLAAGTILGGVWADYSWGRFWGWDPKEVWALVALLLYLAVLHGRFTGWLKGFGFTAAIVFCFLGVLMAWYGVNFVLGVGLHSYGFGSGGLPWVLGYIVAQALFVGLAYRRYLRVSNPKTQPAIFPRN